MTYALHQLLLHDYKFFYNIKYIKTYKRPKESKRKGIIKSMPRILKLYILQNGWRNYNSLANDETSTSTVKTQLKTYKEVIAVSKAA